MSWCGHVFAAVPASPGYVIRTKYFQQRFAGCADLGALCDRTLYGQHVNPVDTREIQAVLDGSIFMLVRPDDDTHLRNDPAVANELRARFNSQWLVEAQPKPKIIPLVDGHLNLESFLPLYRSATELGIKIVVLNGPGHWLLDPSLRHMFQDFIPIDMTPDETFHHRIADAVKGYGPVDGICAIATACLAPVARAATILGLPTSPPDAMECANDKYQTRLLAGGCGPSTLVNEVSDLQDRIAEKKFVPLYPSIVKPSLGAGSENVYRADNEVELVEAVRRACERSRRKVLVEAYIDGPELDVNYVLQNGEILFFEMSDDFPSPGDDGTIDCDFWETTTVLPSRLPSDEWTLVRESLHRLLLTMGLVTGVFHLEAHVRNSSMEYSTGDGVIDLRAGMRAQDGRVPRSYLIEINPRPPGAPCVTATAGAYGVNMYDMHLLACLAEDE